MMPEISENVSRQARARRAGRPALKRVSILKFAHLTRPKSESGRQKAEASLWLCGCVLLFMNTLSIAYLGKQAV